MNHIKSLGSQSVIYGLSSIVPRFLNYLLVPLYNYNYSTFEIGQVTLLYTYIIFLNILLTYGMETGFFYFSKKEDGNPSVFGTAFISLLVSTIAFLFLTFWFIKPIAHLISFTENPRYIFWFLLIVGLDTLSAIPFAKLRYLNKAYKFAFIKLLGVSLNIILNILLIWVIPKFFLTDDGTIFGFKYKLDIEVIFIANLFSSLLVLILLLPIIFNAKYTFSKVLLRKLLFYSFPLMIAGFAGTINDTLDRILLQYFLPSNVDAISEIGIYGSSAKLAVLMTLFIQMFRFAAEPYFFNQKRGEDQNIVLADVSKYFIYYGLIIFLGVLTFIDILKYFIGPPEFWPGLRIMPVYLFAKLCVGIYFNLSFWYKLSGKTYYGIIIMFIGTIISVFLNILLIPYFSYMGCAVVNLFTYLVMIIVSYYLGRKFISIKYDFRSILRFTGIAIVIGIFMFYLPVANIYINLLKNTIAFTLFLFYLERKEHIFSLFIRK